MAYEIKPQKRSDEDGNEPLTNAPAPEMTQGPPAISGPSYTPRPGASTGAPAAPGVPGSKFVNFDRILNANKDTAEAAASNLTGHLQSQAQAAQSALTGVKGAFDSGVEAGSQTTHTPTQAAPVPPDPFAFAGGGVAVGAAPAPGNSSMDQSFLPPAQRGGKPLPTLNGGPNELDRRVDYTGGTDITKSDGWADLLGKARQSDADLAAAVSPGGLGGLAKQQAGNGADYTAGMEGMDAALLGSVAGGRFADLSQKYGGLGKLIDKGATESNALAAAAQDKVTKHNKGIDDADAAKAAQAKQDAVTGGDQAIKDAVTKSLGGNKPIGKGAWGQVDAGKLDRIGLTVVGKGGQHIEATDGGKFSHAMADAGFSDLEARGLYDKLSTDDILEMRLIYAGPNYGDSGPASEHPYYTGVPRDPGYRDEEIKQALQKWVEKMQKKYNS